MDGHAEALESADPRITISHEDGVRIVALDGPLDAGAAGSFAEAHARLAQSAIVDLRGCTRLDEVGLSALRAARRDAFTHGHGFALVVHPGTLPDQDLRRAGAYADLAAYPDLESAIDATTS